MNRKQLLYELIEELENMTDEEFIKQCIKAGFVLLSYRPGEPGSIKILDEWRNNYD